MQRDMSMILQTMSKCNKYLILHKDPRENRNRNNNSNKSPFTQLSKSVKPKECTFEKNTKINERLSTKTIRERKDGYSKKTNKGE